MPAGHKNGGSGPDLVLHYHPASYHSQKAIMALHQKKLKFRPMFVDLSRGRQFADRFLALNPKGEVPVLVDDVRVIPDSENIINYLEDNFSNGSPRLLPRDMDLRQRAIQINHMVNELKVDAVTFGSVFFEDMELNPKVPWNNNIHRAQMKALGLNRVKMLEAEIIKHPMHADTLRKKLQKFRETDALWQDRYKFLDVLLSFEKVLDECEAELQSHENDQWFLCSPDISIADISFSLILHHLWMLGLDRRMWENRPYVKRYFARVQQVESFKAAITMKGGSVLVDLFTSPWFWGFLGAVAIASGGVYYYNNYYSGESTGGSGSGYRPPAAAAISRLNVVPSTVSSSVVKAGATSTYSIPREDLGRARMFSSTPKPHSHKL